MVQESISVKPDSSSGFAKKFFGPLDWFCAKIISVESSGLPVSNCGSTSMRLKIVKAQLNRDQESGKTALAYVVSMTAGFLAFYNKGGSSVPQLFTLILVSITLGLTVLGIRMLFDNMLPDVIIIVLERFGFVSVYLAFFSVVSSLLPTYLVWLPWTCFASFLVLSILISYIQVRGIEYFRDTDDIVPQDNIELSSPSSARSIEIFSRGESSFAEGSSSSRSYEISESRN